VNKRSLEVGEEEVVISVLKKFLADAIEKMLDCEKFNETIDNTIKD
jgi:hypothetical protein